MTPSYEDTVAWLEHLVVAAPELEMTSIGTSPDERWRLYPVGRELED